MRGRKVRWILGTLVALAVLVATGAALIQGADREIDPDLAMLLAYGHQSTRIDDGSTIRYQVEFPPKTPMLDRELRARLLGHGWQPYTPMTKAWVRSRPHWTGTYAMILNRSNGRSLVLSQYSTGNGYAILSTEAPWTRRAVVWIKRLFGQRL
jgi:hypothetical protein